MKVIVYSFIKKAKSTKIPQNLSADDYTEMDCTLKDNGCGIINPVMQINYGLVKAPVNYNYAWIEAFKRYYYVRDWYFIDGLWYGEFVEDYLSTWKKNILATEAYILRSASKWNGYIADNMYPVTADIKVLSNEIDYPFRLSGTNPMAQGNFVVGIHGFDMNNMFGSTVYYVFTAFQFKFLMSTLLTSTDWLNIDWETAELYISNDILKTLFNPIQYISSCVWIPKGVAADRVTQWNKVNFGWWEIECACAILNAFIPDSYIDKIPIPKHPQAANRGEYLNLSPYTTYQLHVPPYGLVDINADELMGENELSVEWVFDYMTGQGRIMVANSKRFLNIFNIMFGVPISIAQISSNPWQALEGVSGYVNKVAGRVESMINNAVSSVGGALLGSLKGGNTPYMPSAGGGGTALGLFTLPLAVVDDTIGAVGDVATSLSPTVQTTQGAPNGTLIGFAIESFVRLSGKFALIADEDNTRLGRPYCRRDKIGNHRGFVKTLGVSVEIEGNESEQTVLNTMIDGGIYIE